MYQRENKTVLSYLNIISAVVSYKLMYKKENILRHIAYFLLVFMSADVLQSSCYDRK
jgi:hypothetical protein